MSEPRIIDAGHIVDVAQHAYTEWNLAMAAADGTRKINHVYKMQELCKAVAAVAKEAPEIKPETLSIVKELRAKLERYEKAEQEERLVIIPNKLYDLIYDEAAPEKSYIAEYTTEGVGIKFAGDYISLNEIGETIFLTREEAERNLGLAKEGHRNKC